MFRGARRSTPHREPALGVDDPRERPLAAQELQHVEDPGRRGDAGERHPERLEQLAGADALPVRDRTQPAAAGSAGGSTVRQFQVGSRRCASAVPPSPAAVTLTDGWATVVPTACRSTTMPPKVSRATTPSSPSGTDRP